MNDMGHILKTELEARQELNSAYSLRSFARFLETSPATVSQVISGKRHLGRKSQEKMLEKLGFQYSSTPNKRVQKDQIKLEEDLFELIGHWYYFAILSLANLKGSKADPRWIASQLNISPEESNQAINRLERLGIIEINKDKSYRQISPPLKTTDEVPSMAIRNYHKSVLKMAQLKIDEVPVEKREYRALTISGNSKKLKRAKEIIRELKDLVSDTLETGPSDTVYQLSIQLFPLVEKENI
ncbi:MAG: DUF4423 domain-containing protein [Bacteriovoracaceae bacterium]|nr:DUF4423 domain-containing protein [Bacteriovoracaceae bacterium]